jgi:hypothetical protein
MPIPTPIFQPRMIYDRTVGGDTRHRRGRRYKKWILIRKELKARLSILIIRKKYVGKLYLELLNIVSDEMCTFLYKLLILYLTMSSVSTISTMM